MEMFVVGGAVRDRLMGLVPQDVDYVVVGATPEDMLAQGYKQVGADFPVFLDEAGNEFALARTERKSGRGYMGFDVDASPDVTLEQDLERRDLTVNAMAIACQAEEAWMPTALVDPFNGREDLKNKVLRHVSVAFADDPVRVLRLARFHARYGAAWSVAPETMEFCRQMVQAGELAFLTRERVLKELEKALAEQAPHLFFATLRECGALDVVFPELKGLPLDVMQYFPSRSAKFNFAKLTTLLTDSTQFEKRLNFSIEFRAYAKLFRDAVSLRHEHTVDRLYRMDVFRKADIFAALVADARAANFSLEHLVEAFEAVKHVNFESLPDATKADLKGPEISEAIKKMRFFAFETADRRK